MRLHAEMRSVLEDLLPTEFQLKLTLSQIALQAGKVRRVPGIIQIRRYEPFKRFKPKDELNLAMLRDGNAIKDEGRRTDQLVELHERFHALLHKKTRLDIDRKRLKAQAIQATEGWEAIAGLWSYRRRLTPTFSVRAFREAHRMEAAASSVAGAPFIHRKVFLSRSY